MITEPTVWTEPELGLAYKLIDLDDTMKVGSCAKDDILEVLHTATGVGLKLQLAVQQNSEHSVFLEQLDRLPWSKQKTAKILETMNMTV